jgi:excisionase family DNA binding protein
MISFCSERCLSGGRFTCRRRSYFARRLGCHSLLQLKHPHARPLGQNRQCLPHGNWKEGSRVNENLHDGSTRRDAVVSGVQQADAVLPAIITAEETASVLRLGLSVTYRLLRSNVIPNTRIGKQYRVPRDALMRWLASTSGYEEAGSAATPPAHSLEARNVPWIRDPR